MSELLRAIRRYADTRPDAIALQTGTVSGVIKTLSYSQLIDKIDSLSQVFQDNNIQRIGLCLDNSIEWIITDLAAMQAGITIVPMPLFFSQDQFQYLIDNAQLDCLITSQHWLEYSDSSQVLKNYKTSTNELDHIDIFMIAIHQSMDRQSIQTESLHQVQKITYTSGSTGNPKGVCLDAKVIEQVSFALARGVQSLELQRHLCIMPLATLLENIAGVYVPLIKGCTVHVEPLQDLGIRLSSQLDHQQFIRALEIIRPHSMIALPQLLQLLVVTKSQSIAMLDYLRFIAVGGGKTPSSLIKQALKLELPVFEGYGLSECASVVSLNTPENYRAGSVGKPLFMDSVNTLADGEIIVQQQGMLGYLSDCVDERAQSVIKTGDIGYFDDDGFLYLHGRKKNLIISSFGRNISPEWVESELNLSVDIRQCVVYGESKPFLSALIVLADGANKESLEQSIQSCNQRLPDYAQVRRWLCIDSAFSSDNGLLTYNGRPRRNRIIQQYQIELDALYPTHSPKTVNNEWSEMTVAG